MAWNWVNESGDIDSVFLDFTSDIAKVVEIITTDVASYGDTASVVEAVFSVVYVIGLNLAVLFFMLSFLKKSVMFEYASMENVVKTILLLFVAKFVLESSWIILDGIYQGVTWMIVQVNNSVGTNEQFSAAVQAAIDILTESLEERQESLNPIDNITFNLRFLPMWLTMVAVKLLVQVIAYGRIIEIIIHQCVAPIPLATIVSEDFSHVALKFMKSYIGVCLQGFFMLILCFVYQALMLSWLQNDLVAAAGDTDIGLGGLVVCTVVFGFVMWKSGEWAKRITGAM